MFRVKRIIDYLIPNDLKKDPYLYRKAIALTYLHLFIPITTAIIYLTCLFLKLDNDPNLLLGIVMSVLFIFIFKKYKSLFISSNLLSILGFLILGFSIPSTGGLHSDNLLWLIITPLIALLFGSKKAGLFWLSLLIGFVCYIYAIDVTGVNINRVKSAGNIYYVFSYIFLFTMIYGVVLIFEKGQELIISMLQSQKQELESQKQEILKKNGELEAMKVKLKETNIELENFAYTASHDLKEPLRMIGMYTQMTQRRMKGKLDDDSIEFMGYVTDGVSRMQNLLTDLLQYSRLGKNIEDVKDINLNETLFHVIHNLTVTLKETNASITAATLPTINASATEMTQLMQNLIANAIKFRKKGVVPEIEILYKEKKDLHFISIKDNGIGIKKEYQHKIFGIFERLHGRDKYEGSGIGLATCKKIVSNLGGKIWLRSTEGVGTTFYIAIPKVESFVVINQDELVEI